MVVEEQCFGAAVGYDLMFYSDYGSDEWLQGLGDPSVFQILEIFFGVLFTTEVTLRMFALGREYWKRPSEYFDLGVVIASDVSILTSDVLTSYNIQILRLLRAAKLLRLIKLLRTLEGFDALHVMTTALRSSAWALLWSTILLFTIQTFIAMLASNVFRTLYFSEGSRLTEAQQLELFEYFGTFSRSILTLFELALANWPPVCRFLMDNLNEVYMVLVLWYKLVMGFAVVGVLNGVFMQETFKVANNDDEIMLRTQTRVIDSHRQKMVELFEYADVDRSGHLNLREFKQVLSDHSIQTWLASMDLDASDADMLFDLLRGDDDVVTLEELVSGITHLKGAARSIDLHAFWKIYDGHHLVSRKRIDPTRSALAARNGSFSSSAAGDSPTPTYRPEK